MEMEDVQGALALIKVLFNFFLLIIMMENDLGLSPTPYIRSLDDPVFFFG